jgi:hypothetical protein
VTNNVTIYALSSMTSSFAPIAIVNTQSNRLVNAETTNSANTIKIVSLQAGNFTNAVYFHTNAVALATLKAGFTNGSFAIIALSNALMAVWMSNNVTLFKKLAP